MKSKYFSFLIVNLFLVSLCILINCKEIKPQFSCQNEKQLQKGNSNENIKIDFSLWGSELVKSIQSQTAIDLCTYPLLNAEMYYGGKKVEFPLLVFDNCNQPNQFKPNFVRILIDSKSNVIINNHALNKEKELSNTISKLSDILIAKSDYPSKVIYLIEWDLSVDVEFLKGQIVQILKGILKSYNNYSLKKYQMNVCELKAKELMFIDNQYKGVIGIGTSISNIPLPPPPPPTKKMN